jgi:hypothetical protein
LTSRVIYVALAVTTEGRREILGLWAGDGGEGAKHWLHILTEIKNRGVSDVLMLVCDGLKGLPDAVGTVWPATIVQTCVVHLLRNSFRYAARQDWDKIAKVLKPLYTAPTEEAALDRFAEFAAAWGKKYPAIVRLWENAWEEFTPFLRFDSEIRRIVCTTQRDRVGQRADPPGGQGSRPLPQRAGQSAQVPGILGAWRPEPVHEPPNHRASRTGCGLWIRRHPRASGRAVHGPSSSTPVYARTDDRRFPLGIIGLVAVREFNRGGRDGQHVPGITGGWPMIPAATQRAVNPQPARCQGVRNTGEHRRQLGVADRWLRGLAFSGQASDRLFYVAIGNFSHSA